MAFQPMDIQVNVMQSANVANVVANEEEAPQRAKADQVEKWIEKRQQEENTSDETGEQNEHQSVDEDQGGNNSFLESDGDGSESGDSEEDSLNAERSPSEPDKGTHLDLKT